MITLKTLRWDNCFSYGKDNTLYLDDCTLTQLIGTNGMGKSSVPLIIEEVVCNGGIHLILEFYQRLVFLSEVLYAYDVSEIAE